MRILLLTGFLITQLTGLAQADVRLRASVEEFHRALVRKDLGALRRLSHLSLSYGHSNGWIETRAEMLKNLENGYISYTRFRADSIRFAEGGKVAHVRFIGDINATLDGKNADYYLTVLEVWVKQGRRWLLFARQSASLKK
ncbi:MAG TPA: nuclear transport factor 2 family protein [Chitinophagaceae bacterium]|nr:nuclear transport factor 2 family protein [Chitinophagaceae bacterium]